MPRTGRSAPGGKIYHVLNRGNGRCDLFHKEQDFAAFQDLLFQVREAAPMRILAWCLMTTHWHLVLWPIEDGQLSSYMLRLTTTHVRRHHAHYHTDCGGHLYQGRFKSFPVQDDHHFLTLCRYVEANPFRAGIVKRAEQWPWSSLWAREHARSHVMPDAWPVRRPRDWKQVVNEPMQKPEIEQVQASLNRGRPLGSDAWVRRVADELGLGFTLRDRGRPRKMPAGAGK
ncbi:MAG TPA: transposase [Tepidisphaeraceae bacterium]|nr:transposase [Tepidisphaeraceae bacterium]